MGAQRVLMLAQLIEGPVESIIIDRLWRHPEQVIQRGRLIPVFGHAQLGRLAAKPGPRNQGCYVGPRNCLATRGHQLGQQGIESDAMLPRERPITLPKLPRALNSQGP
jgi:hypothetical protein